MRHLVKSHLYSHELFILILKRNYLFIKNFYIINFIDLIGHIACIEITFCMNWNLSLSWIIGIIYLVILVLICLRIIYETRSTNKTLAYLLFCIFIPLIGIAFYLVFGINYWRKKLYEKKQSQDEKILDQLKKNISLYT